MSPSRHNGVVGSWNDPIIHNSDPPKPKYKDAAVNIIILDVADNGKDRSKMTVRIDQTTTADLETAFDAIDPYMHSRGHDVDDRKLQNLLLVLDAKIAKNPDEQLKLHYRRADRTVAVALSIRQSRHALKLVYGAWDYLSEDAVHLYLCRSRKDIVEAPWRYLQVNTWPEEERFRRVAEVDSSCDDGLW